MRRPDLTLATMDHNVPTDRGPDRRSARPRADRGAAARTARSSASRSTAPAAAAGHRPRHRPRAGPDAARHDDRLRRQPHLDARRLRRARVRHRHVRGRARPGDADACRSAKPKTMRVASTGALPPGVTAKDVILGIIGQIGVAGGVGHVIEYAGDGDPRPLDGRAHDDLQHVDRGRRPRRDDRAGRRRRSPTSRAARSRRAAPRGSARSTTGARCRPTPAPRYDREVDDRRRRRSRRR